MKKFLIAVALIVVAITAQAATKESPNNYALSKPGKTILFQFGTFYSNGYAVIINKYDEQDLLPASLGEESMTRFGFGYNFTPFFGMEWSLSDNGVDFNESRKDYIDSGTVQQKYNFDVYNTGVFTVFRAPMIGYASDIHFKFGMVYSYAKETINYDTSSGLGPAWNNYGRHFHHIYTASGLAPVFGFGFGWSVSKYLAYQLDYQHVFKPIVGNGAFGDPLNSSMQSTNMWLIGVVYHF